MYNTKQIIHKRKELWEKNKSLTLDKQYIDSIAKELLINEDLRQEIHNNPEYIVEMFFYIVNKDKDTEPFFTNDVQQALVAVINTAKEDYKANRIVQMNFLVLKGRQQGITSFITAYQLAACISRHNYEGFTAADEDSNASVIFENKAKFPFSRLPEEIKPHEKYNSKKQLLFDKLNSSWETKTASKNMGRSRTIMFFHGSEAAFWKDGIASIQAGLGEALTKHAVQILESTANGFNEFKDLWDSGKWINIFFEWWRTSEYRFKFENDKAKKEFCKKIREGKEWIHERCCWLIDVKNLDLEQVYWYYCKYNSYMNPDLIKQEYPVSAEEAFLESGRCVFNKENIIHRIGYLKELYKEHPPRRGYFSYEWNDPETKDKIKTETIHFVDSPNGYITIYEEVQRGYPYVLPGDTKGDGRDFYSGVAINNVTGNRAAVLHAQMTNSKPYTWQMYCLGLYYNIALIGIEVNFNTAPIEELQRLKYPKQYIRRQYDKKSMKFEERLGWKTDGNTRPLIIDKQIDLIENNIELFNDLEMLSEAITFVNDENNRPDAVSGKHDDILIADMIGNEIRSQQSYKISEETTEQPKKWINTIKPKKKAGLI